MSFLPGQIITAQRLNRLQPKTYWSVASGSVSTVSSGNLAGTAISITTETDGATAACSWTAGVYATGAMASNSSTQAKYDLATAPVFALGQYSANGEKGISANFWSTSIATAGTYTFQLAYSNVANGVVSFYSTLMVVITEVA
jgi:hypothetical protein